MKKQHKNKPSNSSASPRLRGKKTPSVPPADPLEFDTDEVIRALVDNFRTPNGIKIPYRKSFEEFLLKDGRVPIGGGRYGPYTFEGREPLRAVVRLIDQILGNVPFPADDSSPSDQHK